MTLKIRTAEELGTLLRTHRKARGLTLAETAGLANISIKFLSEFERGKPTAEIGKVLKVLGTIGLDVLVQPRDLPRDQPEAQAKSTSGIGDTTNSGDTTISSDASNGSDTTRENDA